MFILDQTLIGIFNQFDSQWIQKISPHRPLYSSGISVDVDLDI